MILTERRYNLLGHPVSKIQKRFVGIQGISKLSKSVVHYGTINIVYPFESFDITRKSCQLQLVRFSKCF